MRRRRLLPVLAVSLTVAAAGCSPGPPPAPPSTCVGVGTVRFDAQDPLPACDVTMDLDAIAGSLSQYISVELPAGGRYGPVDGPAHLTIHSCVAVGAYRCRGDPASASLSSDGPFRGGLFVGTGMGPMGSCRVTASDDRMTLACDLEVGRDVLRVTADLPSAPDPRSDPSLAWFEAAYTFSGDYQADAVVEFVGPTPWSIVIPLADGGLLSIAPNGTTDGTVAWLTLPGSGGPASPWLPDEQTPSLGACIATIDAGARNGTLDCPGDPSSASGSSTLVLTWRPAR
jgi:hypothetical protein